MRLHFVDVGQGDAIWIQTPDDGISGNGYEEGYNILIDTGHIPLEDAPGTGPVLIDYLNANGLPSGATIDFLIITHAHSDHYGGGIPILQAYNVVNVLDPGFDNNDNSTYTDFLQMAQAEVAANGGHFYRPLVGTLVQAEYDTTDVFGSELTVTVLNSESQLRQGDSRDDQINNTSIALSIEYAGVTVLLMGDSYAEVESDIIQALPDLRANILKVGHHGSTSGTSEAFLEQIFGNDVPQSRRFAVIESGRRSFSGTTLPAPSTVARLHQFVFPENLFSTQFGDEDKTEAEAPGDDNVQAVIRANGDISMCYTGPTPTE
jgi:competence protein ComEC